MPRFLPLVVLAIAVALGAFISSPPVAPADDGLGPPIYQTTPGIFSRLPPNGGPSLAPGNPGESGNQGDCGNAYAPSVLYDPNSNFQGMGPYNFFMYYTGQCADTGNGNPNMNMAISGDGVIWGKYAIAGGCAGCENPVMDPRGGRFDRQVIAPSILDDTAGDCRCYRVLYEGNNNNVSQIGLATTGTGVDFLPSQYAQGQIRPDDPVFRPGAFAYMSGNVGDPTWIKDGGLYKMWFTAIDTDGRSSIGYATSTNGGLTWNANATPVLVPGGAGTPDTNFVGEPMVLRDRNGIYRMWYSGADSFNTRRIIYATSTDGVNWAKYGFNGGVVMTLPNDDVLNGSAYDPAVVEDEFGNWWLWFAGVQKPNNFLIFMGFNPRPLLNDAAVGATSVSGKGTPQTNVVVSYVDNGQVLANGQVDSNGNFFLGVPAIQSGRQIVATVDGRSSNVIGAQGPTPTATSVVPTATPTIARQVSALSLFVTCTTCGPTRTPTISPTPTINPATQGTWRLNFNLPFTLTGISMVSSTDGFAVGGTGLALRGGSGGWLQTATGVTQTIRSVHSVNSNFAVAAGDNGQVIRWNGTTWGNISPGGATMFTGVSLNSQTSGWVSGDDGKMYPWNGVGVGAGVLAANVGIRGVTSLAPNTALAVTGSGDNSIYQWTGSIWQKVTAAPAVAPLNGIEGFITGNSLSGGFAVGDGGVILQYNPNTFQWGQISSPTLNRLNAVALLSPTDGWAVGDGGTVLRLAGGQWSLYPQAATAASLRDVWIVSATEVWAAGDGVILRYTVP